MQPIPTLAVNTFKGGVSKTTLTFNLSWYLSQQGKRVLIVDSDPQCNFSQIFLEGYRETNEEVINSALRGERPLNHPCTNIGEALSDVVNVVCVDVPPVSPIQHPYNPHLFLLPGSMFITDYEAALATAEQAKIPAMRNIPGAFYHLIQASGRLCNADLIIIDTSPSMGCLNMVIVMFSKYFIVPCQADRLSLEALRSLRKRMLLSGDNSWLTRMAPLRDYASASRHPLPNTHPLFLGTVVQMFTIKHGFPTAPFQKFINEIKHELLIMGEEFFQNRIALHKEIYRFENPVIANIFDNDPGKYGNAAVGAYYLAQIKNFNRFSPLAQDSGVPVIALYDFPELIVSYTFTSNDQGLYDVIKKQLLPHHLAKDRDEIFEMTAPIRTLGKLIIYLMSLRA